MPGETNEEKKTRLENSKNALANEAARLANEKLAFEIAQSKTPEAIAAAAAGHRKSVADADKAATDARLAAAKAFVPDLTSVNNGEVKTEAADPPLFSGALVAKAFQRAASQVRDAVVEVLPVVEKEQSSAPSRVLLTSDAQLATSHGAYVEVVAALRQLIGVANSVLENTPAKPAPHESFTLAAAIVSAIPGVLSLFASTKSIKSASIDSSATEAMASAAVAGALIPIGGVTLVDDGLRLLSRGALRELVDELAAARQSLVVRKLELDGEVGNVAEKLAAAKAALATLEAVDEAEQDGAAIEDAKGLVGVYEATAGEIKAKLGLVEGTLTSVTDYQSALVASGENGPSPLVLASLREHLLDQVDDAAAIEDADRFTHVLFVQGQGGQAQQLIDDKPVFTDRFASVVTASIAYKLMSTETSSLVAAGVATGGFSGHGNLKDFSPTFAPVKSL